ncbi:MAG TPA: lytic transglycosylase domain-containing protein [Burkholderiales bacterium]|nr:lytic transglycosylase domain-containing protein [Burkholderiales bacterium]
MLVRVLAVCCLVGYAHDALAARVEIPLRVSLDTLGEALGAQLVPYRDGRCRYLDLQAPKLEFAQGRLRLVAPGTGLLAVEIAGKCQGTAWKGTIHLGLVPYIEDGARLRVRVVDSRLVDASGGLGSLLWDAAKQHIHARLERFAYDLGASRDALAELLRSAAPPSHAAAMQEALRQVAMLSPRPEPGQVVVPIALEVPDAWLAMAPAAASPAPLTEAELEALEQALEPWDAFLVYVVRQMALDGEDEVVRKRLFTLLLDSRYQLAAILAGESAPPGNPVRELFLEAWNELRAILVETKRHALFFDATDALAALEAAAPGLPLSPEGLRRLARNLRPDDTGNPLAYDWALDPQLGRLFGVEGIPEGEPTPAAPPTRSWLDFFISRAHADTPLDRWVPTHSEFAAYGARIGSVLQKIATAELQRTNLSSPYDAIYAHLVPTTALIESCWRQYVVRGGKVTYLRSHSGSVGIMQINQRVWRGFYDIERVRWDTAYNVRAGTQILLRYLKDYAIPYAERTGDPDHAPRAAYAVYNAGPKAVGRFAKSPPHPREARVDEKLWTLYQAIAEGGQVDLETCGVKQARATTR